MNDPISDEAYFLDADAILSLMLSGSEEAYFLVDRDLHIRFYNDTASKEVQKHLGKTLHLGIPIMDLVTDATRISFLQNVYAGVLKGSIYESELQFLHQDETFFYRYNLRPSKNKAGEIIAVIVTVYNITGKRTIENNLKDNEERLRFALEGSNHGIWDWNIKSGAIFFSPSWKKMLGFEEGELQNNINEWERRIHPDDKAQLTRDLQTHYDSEQPTYENSYRLQAKDGTFRWVLGRGKIVERLPDGTPLRMIGTHTDITEKRTSEAQYRDLFDINPLPTWIYDFETFQFLAVNKAAVTHYLYSKDEFLRMRIFDVHPPEQFGLLQHRINMREQETLDDYSNWKHKKKNGELFIAEVNSTTITYDGRKARLVVVNDITEKVATDEALRRSNQRFQYVTKATSDAIYDLNIATGHVTWGEGLTTLFGYAASEMTFTEWEGYIHPDERDAVSTSLHETIYNSRKKLWKAEYRFLKQDSAYRYVIDKGFILRDADNKPLRMIGAMQDITNLKQKQLELAESNKRYEYATLASSDVIWDWILESNCVLWSENYEKLTGWKLPADKCLSIETCLERFHESNRERVFQSMNEALMNTKQSKWEAELKYLKSNGDIAHIHNRAYILRNETGLAVRMIGAMQDITERKKLEEQLLQKELDKQKLISKATIDTQERERSEIGKELHDNVNQVLTTTKLYLELALNHAELTDDLLHKSQNNIMYVINEIRQLSRSLINPSLGDLGLVDSINDLVEDITATRRLHVIFEAPETVDAALPGHLKLTVYRIVQEALNNAVKHAQATAVSVFMQLENHNFLLSIKDNGIGFNPEGVKKGAGLISIQNRVYLANGRFEIKSKAGAGCTLSIHLNLQNTTIQ